ncbi:hypothetical protein AB4Z13_00455 [Rhizobium sp. YAF28]|uniref:hypothetical protein n=1 Tax=Rhizobium sp. YAF28 TaxID=3233081 RepID=UPI003F969AE7
MAKLHNMQRVQGVVIVPDGTRMFNNRPVIGIRDVGGATLFTDNKPVLGIDIISDGATVYNDLPVLGTDDPAWPGILDGINAWIVAQAGREGVMLCNTLALDGPASGISPAMFVDGLHPKPDLMAKRSDILLPILQGMVSAGETRSLDPLAAYNIFPPKGTPGTTGTKTNVTGDVATGMRLVRGTGTSTYVGSKEVLAAGNEKQVITITPVNDALAVHTLTYGLPANLSLTTLGLVAGDWLEIQIPVELNDWAGWDYLDSSIRGPVQIGNTVTVTSGGWTTGNYIGGRNRSLICGSKLWLPTGLTMTNIRLDNLLILRHLCNTGGTGVAKIGAPIIRKLAADPRAAWKLAT